MPPCGYRSNAVGGIVQFLGDNLAYFIDLYCSKGVAPLDAIETEIREIKSIQSGARGGEWSGVTVGINLLFYNRLLQRRPVDWDAVALIGRDLIKRAENDLKSLDQHPGATS
jgi:hypothetical protein